MDLIVASNNKGKIIEYKKILEPLGFNVISQSEAGINIEVEETGTTFEENSYLKAKAIYDIKKTPVISDDSGLEVEYLNNEPGLYSARYKGLQTEYERRISILEQLKEINNRKARFICCICYIDEKGNNHTFKGIWNGSISTEESGTNGFGYDSIFIPEGQEQTTASLPIEFKNENSHRARATKMLLDYLKSLK